MGRRQAGRYFSCVPPAFVNDDLFVFLVDLDEGKVCARDIHKKCAESLVKSGTDLCINVNDFVTCYDRFINGTSPLPSTCTKIPEITTKFDEIIDRFSGYLMKQYETNRQSMCHVDTGALDGDDCMGK